MSREALATCKGPQLNDVSDDDGEGDEDNDGDALRDGDELLDWRVEEGEIVGYGVGVGELEGKMGQSQLIDSISNNSGKDGEMVLFAAEQPGGWRVTLAGPEQSWLLKSDCVTARSSPQEKMEENPLRATHG